MPTFDSSGSPNNYYVEYTIHGSISDGLEVSTFNFTKGDQLDDTEDEDPYVLHEFGEERED